MTDVPVGWKKITRGLPKSRRFADDHAPTLEEIQKICEYPDRRINGIVYTMSSSGIRLGAWDYLRWHHIEPIRRNGKVVAAKVLVYAGDDEYYISKLYFDSTKGKNVTGSESVNNAIRVIHAQALFSGQERTLGLRVPWGKKNSWTVALLIPDIPHPKAIIHGEKGGLKTTFCKYQKRLVDPGRIEVNNIPK